MKKVFCSFLLLGAMTVHAQTVEEIIQKYSANLGGLDAFNKISTARMTGTYSTQGMEFPLTIRVVNGKAVRTDVEAMGNQITNVYNKGKGWKQNAFAGAPTPTEVTGAELNDLKTQSSLVPVLLNYKALGHTVELTGQADVEGIKTYKIKLSFKNEAKVTNYYISTSDYVLIKSESDRDVQGQMMTVESYYSNLKEFGGVKFYLSRDQRIKGETIQSTKIDSIQLNVPSDDKIFEMPEQ